MNNYISRTVYSICYPETKKALNDLFKDSNIPELFNKTWSKKQDPFHLPFFDS